MNINKLTFKHLSGVFFALTFAFSFSTSAAVIVSATDAVISAGGPGFGDITDTYDQSGLYDTYLSGETDFDAYLATNPFHTSDYNFMEWFSEMGTGASPVQASVIFDLGRLMKVSAIALWNEESSGIGLLDLFGSTDGNHFFNLAAGLTPIDNLYDESRPDDDYRYAAEVFGFSDAAVRYIRFDMSACPNQPSSFDFCSIGEVAFRATAVPEPSAALIFVLGLLVLGASRQKGKMW